MSFTRTLKFRTDQTITKPISLMLTFDKVPSTPSLNQVAWRVLNFGGSGQWATVTYAQSLIFASVQLEDGNRVSASAVTPIQIGQKTELDADTSGAVSFSTPVPGNPGELTATNDSGLPRGLAIGFMNGIYPNPLLVWPNVGNTNSVDAVFTPMLSVYATSDYQQTELITGEIVSPVLLNQNLAYLPLEQVYTLKRNPDGSYIIVPEQPAAAVMRARIKFDPGFDDYIIGDSSSISVTNNLPSIIYVKVSNATSTNGSDAFFQLRPGTSDSWARKGAETISVNVGGAGRVANYFGVLGRNLQINAA